jgi:hypothetical protein
MSSRERTKARYWLYGGLLFGVLVGAAAGFGLLRAIGFPAGMAGAGAARTHAQGGNGASAGRSQAQRALQEARYDAAFDFYRRLADGRWEAGDLFTLGTSLLERDRTALGWTALEAARRLDPSHRASSVTLDELHSKLTRAGGRDRTELQAAAAWVELLRAVREPEPLGIFVLGLARYARDAAAEQELLDRLRVRGRAALQAVRTIDDALKLVARLLLEQGRADEARALLEAVSARSGTGLPSLASETPAPAQQPPDPETAWLLSRAALQLDRHEVADAMLALAGGFLGSAAAAPEPAPYVGSKRCRDCHHALHRAAQRESRHARTLWRGPELKAVPLPTGPVSDATIPNLTHTFTRARHDRIDMTSQTAGPVLHAVIEYALGSGRHGITMLARDEHGIYREARVSYFHAGESWGQTKSIEQPIREPADVIGQALAPAAAALCLDCHATWFPSVYLNQTWPRGPEAEDHGIGCERCHGPGLHHVKAVETGFAQLAIALGAGAPAAARLRSCTACHAADGTLLPSDPEFTRAQGTTLLFSRCYTASNGRFDCTTCHDPHGILDENTAHYEAKCLACHPGATKRPHEDGGRSLGPAGAAQRPRGPSCPVNPAGQCVSCHMPQVEVPTRRARFTDHHIRVHDELPGAHALNTRD